MLYSPYPQKCSNENQQNKKNENTSGKGLKMDMNEKILHDLLPQIFGYIVVLNMQYDRKK